MATQKYRICSRCRKTVEGDCPTCPKPGKVYDDRRGSSTKRGYDYRWQQYIKAYKNENPLCVECLENGRTEAVFAVDHIVPHRGDMKLFWDIENHQSLCASHHSEKTGRGE